MNNYVNLEVTILENNQNMILVYLNNESDSRWIPKALLIESEFVQEIKEGDSIKITLFDKVAKRFGWL